MDCILWSNVDSNMFFVWTADPVTGITCTSVVPGGQSCIPPMVTPHNYNLFIHQQLFPDLQSSCKVVDGSPLPDRLTRYERALLQGHKTSLVERHLDKCGMWSGVKCDMCVWEGNFLNVICIWIQQSNWNLH
jgi:hypothetical protein